jgi:hypothetical protein
MWKRTLLALTLTSAALGCAPGVETRIGSCDLFVPIRPTPADVATISDGLVTQLVTHNETGARLCGWEAGPAGDGV